mgnify:CR=1 FL=1|uniref:Uncharacterized protein n=1 Tax=viral metagenome TaxID=1070528 RepID=A0A6C0JA98_9ZZZZ
MSKQTLFTYVLILFTLMVVYQIWRDTPYFQLTCLASADNGESYCVRDRDIPDNAVQLLSNIDTKLKQLVEKISSKYPKEQRVKRLKDGFINTKIEEILPTSKLTAYSENKGEKMAFCLHKKKNGYNTEMIDENTLTFVALHELSHVMTLSVGHEPEFWDNFKFLIDEASQLQLYKPVDYSNSPKEYCGMEINDSPYFE